MAKTTFAGCPCFLCPAFSHGHSACGDLALLIFKQGDTAHLRPIVAVLCSALNANLVIPACFVASRPRELMVAVGQEPVDQAGVHGV